MTTTATTPTEVLDDPREVLAFARSCQVESDRAQANQFIAAATWAEQHPPESIHDAATWLTGGYETPHGPRRSGRTAGGGVLHRRVRPRDRPLHRLRTRDDRARGRGEVPPPQDLGPHRVRRPAGLACPPDRRAHSATHAEAAAFVDAQVAAFRTPHRHRRVGAPRRGSHRPVHARYRSRVRRSSSRAAGGSTSTPATSPSTAPCSSKASSTSPTRWTSTTLSPAAPHHSRPAGPRWASTYAGRRRLVSSPATSSPSTLPTTAGQGGRAARNERTVETTARARRSPGRSSLYVHLSEAAIRGETGTSTSPGSRTTSIVVTADQVHTWCANPDTNVVVKPVIDLDEHIHVEAYEAPDGSMSRRPLINHTCVFPWCNRPARTCDSEHCVAYARGGTTCSCNVAPLCRRHHRLKTHTTWRYTILEPGTFLWSSPHGYQLLRDHHGTLDVSADTRPRPPEH